jgi:hypothetical protein
MSLSAMKTQMQTSMDYLSEDMTYNDVAIKGVPEIGASLDKAPNYDMSALADIAAFGVTTKYVASPKSGDKIVYNGVTYTVENKQLSDTLAGVNVLYVTSKKRGFGRA